MSSGCGGGERVADLDPSHADLLARFPSRRLGEPWTAVVAQAIRTGVASHLGSQFRGVGLFVDDELRAVAIWRVPSLYGYPPPPASWELCYLASHSSYPRRGYACRLKIEVLKRARAEGIDRVISYVDWDNEAMLSLNDKLHARRTRIPGDDDFALCVCMVRDCLARLGE
jgi:RimJ/RimL family protein N-acetyltransferase